MVLKAIYLPLLQQGAGKAGQVLGRGQGDGPIHREGLGAKESSRGTYGPVASLPG